MRAVPLLLLVMMAWPSAGQSQATEAAHVRAPALPSSAGAASAARLRAATVSSTRDAGQRFSSPEQDGSSKVTVLPGIRRGRVDVYTVGL